MEADSDIEMMDQAGDMANESEERAAELATESEDMSDDMDSGNDLKVANLPAWQTSILTNARTGQPFALADFAGKTVFVEPMATWCPICHRQLNNLLTAKQELASDEVVFITLSVETNIGDAALANYAIGAGFDWRFAVMTPEFLRDLVDEFGQTISNPPATPHFIIQPDGTFTELVTGIKPPSQIVSQIQATQG